MNKKYVRINEKDNVAVAIETLHKGFVINIAGKEIILKEDIMQGHKFAIQDILIDQEVIKYRYPIGRAIVNISEGSFVHTHNIKTSLSDKVSYEYTKTNVKSSEIDLDKHYFDGYLRKNGKVGIRNEIWIIPTVGCVNNVATEIARCSKEHITGNTQDVIAFNHPYGCSQMGDDQENTRKILADLVNHPNAGGVLVLGLGCENSGVEQLKTYIGEYDESRIKFIVAQECQDEIEQSINQIIEINKQTSQDIRTKVSCEHLIIGLKCGGSDGLSGITANPTVGKFSDLLISKGGTTILTEVPEMFGAETILMDRCINQEIFNKTVVMINNFKEYFISHNQVIYENPSPGNKKGGISTLEDKSLGCTQKSGQAPVVDVIDYGETVCKKGLNLLNAPGNDLVASTALAAAGAHIVLFTTGRGTPFACPVPTVKISSNSALSIKKSNWIDFDCGNILDIEAELYDYVIKVASGEKVKSEIMGYHDMAIFKQGVTL